MYSIGESVVCVINSRASLTIGKEYLIENLYEDKKSNILDIFIKNDDDKKEYYSSFRFISKDKFREHILNEILK
jgi:hypothetical protein